MVGLIGRRGSKKPIFSLSRRSQEARKGKEDSGRERVKMRLESEREGVVVNVSRFLGAARLRARVGLKLRSFLARRIKGESF